VVTAWWRCRSRSWSHVRPGEIGILKHEPFLDGKTAKNRVHLDIQVGASVPPGEERKRLVSEKVE